jgi:type IV pilus assembly protein PilW
MKIKLPIEKGFSLVEIMIATSLSLVLIGGVLQIYQSSKTTYNLQNELADLQENERVALDVLNSNIRMAGFFRGVPRGFIETSVDPNNSSLQQTMDGGGTNNDRITVVFQSNTDCLGQDTSGDGIGFSVNTFFVENEQLKCRGNGGADGGSITTLGKNAQVLANNIESMQILYGINTSGDATDVAPDRFVNLNDVSDISKVTGIRIALLIRSAGAVKPQPEPYSYTLLDASPIADSNGDKHKRQVVTSSILLRNAM